MAPVIVVFVYVCGYLRKVCIAILGQKLSEGALSVCLALEGTQ